MLRILFSRVGEPYVGPPTAFSFNVPTRRASGVMSTDKGGRVERSIVRDAVYLGGMCPRCEGTGNVTDIDLTALYDETKSLSEGALTIPGYSMDGWYGRLFEGVGLPMDKPIASFTAKQLDTMLYAPPTKIKVEGINLTFDGIIPKIQKSMLSKDPEAMQPHVRRFVERAVTFHQLPRVRRHPPDPGGAVLEDQRARTSPTCAPCRSATWPTGSASSTSRPWRPCSPACSTCSTRSPRSGSATSRSTGRPARCRAARRSAPR